AHRAHWQKRAARERSLPRAADVTPSCITSLARASGSRARSSGLRRARDEVPFSPPKALGGGQAVYRASQSALGSGVGGVQGLRRARGRRMTADQQIYSTITDAALARSTGRGGETMTIRKSLRVERSVEIAFKVFCEEIGQWWPKGHSFGGK